MTVCYCLRLSVTQLFRELDESGDGLITRKEFSLAIRALGLPHLSKKEVRGPDE